MPPTNDFFAHTLDIVRSVRPLLLPHFGNAKAEQYKTERYNSPVTALDKAAEAHLGGELRLLAPDIPFVGEERGGERGGERFWLCDPIDGTVAFMRGLPHCTTMLALIEDGEVRFSAIYEFVTDMLYHAEKGRGAYENGARIRVSERMPPDVLIGVETQDKELAQRIEEGFQTFKTMTAGYEFIQVARGTIEGRVCMKPYGEDYDFAPGALLVAEAGGRVANIGSRTYDYQNLDFIAANQPVFDALTTGADAMFPLHQVQ